MIGVGVAKRPQNGIVRDSINTASDASPVVKIRYTKRSRFVFARREGK